MSNNSTLSSNGVFRIALITAVLMALIQVIMRDPEGVLNGFLKSFGF